MNAKPRTALFTVRDAASEMSAGCCHASCVPGIGEPTSCKVARESDFARLSSSDTLLAEELNAPPPSIRGDPHGVNSRWTGQTTC